MSWTVKPCPLTIQILIKITIFETMVQSQYFGLWLWKLLHLLNLVCFFQWCVLFMSVIEL